MTSIMSTQFTTSPVSARRASTISPTKCEADFRLGESSRSGRASFDALTFEKMPLRLSRNPSIVTSTDSEVFSDLPSDCFTSANLSRSPSLLTSLFINQSRSQTSRQISSSTSSELPTPVTPDDWHSAASGSGVNGGGCKPILRRCTPSASTSASEDCGVPYIFRFTSANGETATIPPARTLQRKKSCIQFAMAHTVQFKQKPAGLCSPEAVGSRGQILRSPSPISMWDNIPTPLPVEIEEEESDDGGYVEDEEGGFTSDEDDLGTFAGPSTTSWRPPSRRAATTDGLPATASYTIRAGRRGSAGIESTDDNMPSPPQRIYSRGRKVSIAAKCAERCSRHISPPPPEFVDAELDDAPPAARSPSAAELCRRRASGATRRPVPDAAAHRLRGWRSDDPASAFNRLVEPSACLARPEAKPSASAQPPSILRSQSQAPTSRLAFIDCPSQSVQSSIDLITAIEQPRSPRCASPRALRRSSAPPNDAIFTMSVLACQSPCEAAQPGLAKLLGKQ